MSTRSSRGDPKKSAAPPATTNVWSSGASASNSSIRILRVDPTAPGADARVVGGASRAPTTPETIAERIKRSLRQPQSQAPRVLRQPRNLSAEPRPEKEAGGASRAPPEAPEGERRELTEEEREIIREQRRERRRKGKEKKRMEREEEKRAKIYMPKTSKIKFISSQDLQKAASAAPSAPRATVEGKATTAVLKADDFRNDVAEEKEARGNSSIRFLDDEYPELGKESRKDARVLSRLVTDFDTGRPMSASDAESGSEWETEDGGDEEEEGEEEEVDDDDDGKVVPQVEVATLPSSGISYSSILKKQASSEDSALKDSKRTKKKSSGKETSTRQETRSAKEPSATEENKKVRRSDPVTFDLMSMIQMKAEGKKKAQTQKTPATLSVPGGKKSALKLSAGGNKLDSSAPSVRRGKEREKPRKKRKTKVKKIILEERARRREERLRNLEAASAAGAAKVVATSTFDEIPEEEVVQEGQEDAAKAEEVDGISAGAKQVGVDHQGEEKGGESRKVQSEEVVRESDDKGVDKSKREEEKEDESRNGGEDPLLAKAKQIVHSKKFRDYCDHALSPELDECVKQLLSDLVRFQDKQHAKDPVKAKARRRYVIGLREVKKFLVVRKVTLLVLAPDLEASESRGGLNDLVSELRSLADASETPVVFTMNRRRLGRACVRKVQVSCVGVLNYQGSEENFHKMKEILPSLKAAYQERLERTLQQLRPTEEQPTSTSQEEEDHQQSQRLQQHPPPYKFPIEDPSDEIRTAFLNKIRGLVVVQADQPSES